MKRKDAESKLGLPETSKAARSVGLRRSKRINSTGPSELRARRAAYEKFRDELLNDEVFIERLKEKLAA